MTPLRKSLAQNIDFIGLYDGLNTTKSPMPEKGASLFFRGDAEHVEHQLPPHLKALCKKSKFR